VFIAICVIVFSNTKEIHFTRRVYFISVRFQCIRLVNQDTMIFVTSTVFGVSPNENYTCGVNNTVTVQAFYLNIFENETAFSFSVNSTSVSTIHILNKYNCDISVRFQCIRLVNQDTMIFVTSTVFGVSPNENYKMVIKKISLHF
jgi:hypothetical protein